MRILGIDPGLRLTGYGVLDYHVTRPRLVDAGVIRLNTTAPLPERLVELETELDAIITEHEPDTCAVEQLYSNYAHPRTAILMGHARGVILLVARRRGLCVEQFAANRIKQSLTGHGHAAKGQMQRAIQSVFHLNQPPEPADVADALAVALCCGRQSSGARSTRALEKRRAFS
ncbi:MAG TPA: crossover junction endodeoxyribonuclease RuvC [Tepidisphaeraceae bacterium]|nr:crossover junction endodeoxyribonuclease RuvC [Tepidisphaeraceae bacterium]